MLNEVPLRLTWSAPLVGEVGGSLWFRMAEDGMAASKEGRGTWILRTRPGILFAAALGFCRRVSPPAGSCRDLHR